MDSLALLQEFVSVPAPPGQEGALREVLAAHVSELGLTHTADAKGNLLVRLGGTGRARLVVTAHMDEIAMMVQRVEADGRLAVTHLGGLHPWKLGEGPVQILASEGPLDGVLSFGSIHTEDPASTVRQADRAAIKWEMARVFTGLSARDLAIRGVRPGTRVVVHPSCRNLLPIGDHISGYFLDDRADLVAWILALKELREQGIDVLFASTVAEEVGGEGALYLLHEHRPEICIALELGPWVADAPVELTAQPTVWANDSYSAMAVADGELVASIGAGLGMSLQFQALSRGGSDASCAASHGLCARPITLGIPMENSHGFEIIHKDSISQLARLTVALVRAL